MRKAHFVTAVEFVAAFLILFAALAPAQSQRQAAPVPAKTEELSQKDVATLQDQLLQLLRLSPTLAEVVARDPSLLSNSDYVGRYNPALQRFLQDHPDIAHNPDFYLFNNLHAAGTQPAETLERKLWPQNSEPSGSRVSMELVSDGIPFLVFLCVLGALLWLTHVLLENRRWNRIFKLQNDVHSKLIERFGTSQEVLTYMSTEAGKRFLEATPIAVGFEPQQKVPTSVALVLTPLQIGIVLALLGLGLIFLRHSIPDGAAPLLLVGTVVLMPGLGFIISAGMTFLLARRLGLMPDSGGHN